jgi:hypothetical protein
MSTTFSQTKSLALGTSITPGETYDVVVDHTATPPLSSSLALFTAQMRKLMAGIIESSAPVVSYNGQLVYGVVPDDVKWNSVFLTRSHISVSSLPETQFN